jgi:hypothetical protein
MIAKKIIPAGDRRVTNAEFLDWVREAIERREAGMPGKGPDIPAKSLTGDRRRISGCDTPIVPGGSCDFLED